MELSDDQKRLLDAIGAGMPIEERPYRALAATIGSTEEAVLADLRTLQWHGIIKRLGIVVRHHELGYRANAMVVWDIPDTRVRDAGTFLAREPEVTLCYQRPRRLPHWPYNLFCMIHGRERVEVEQTVARLASALKLEAADYALLFSTCRFKQRGARYSLSDEVPA